MSPENASEDGVVKIKEYYSKEQELDSNLINFFPHQNQRHVTNKEWDEF